MKGNSPAFKLKKRVRAEPGRDGGTLLDTHTATICACNTSAWGLVPQLSAGACFEDLAAQLLRQYRAPAAVIRRDLADFLRELLDLDLLDER